MRIFNASSINFHIYDDIIDYGHHAIYYMSKIYLAGAEEMSVDGGHGCSIHPGSSKV